jgi:hypothetical protein
MIKLILILIVLALQNPIPVLGEIESGPTQKQAQTKQPPSTPANNPSEPSNSVGDDTSPHGQSDANGATDNAGVDAYFKGMTPGEKMAAKLTAILCVIGAIQCFVYFRQWKIMQNSSERGLRAYIGVANFSHEAAEHMAKVQDPFPNGFNIFLKNCGQTPAYRVTAYIDWATIAGANQWPQTFSGMTKAVLKRIKQTNRGSASIVGGGEITFLKHQLGDHPDGGTFLEAYEKWKANRLTILIYGAITYDDIYKRGHTTRYCMILMKSPQPPGFSYTACDRHYDAD